MAMVNDDWIVPCLAMVHDVVELHGPNQNLYLRHKMYVKSTNNFSFKIDAQRSRKAHNLKTKEREREKDIEIETDIDRDRYRHNRELQFR